MASSSSTILAYPTPSIVPDGSICTPEDRMRPANMLHCLTRGETIGLTLVTAAGFLSLFSVLYLFAGVLNNVIQKLRKGLPVNLVRLPMDVYMLSLFSANLLHASGEVFNTPWVRDGKVYAGPLCWAQGILPAVASSAIALTTLAIALHTLLTVFWSMGMVSLFIPRLVVISLWLLVLLIITGIDATHRRPQQGFMGPTPEWCFVTNTYAGLSIAEEWVWLWIAAIVCLCSYIPIAIWSFTHPDPRRRRMARIMIAYPLVFGVMVIPKSITRVIQLVTKSTNTPPAETLGFQVLYNLIGFVDVVLFFKTRRGLLLFDDAPKEHEQFDKFHHESQMEPEPDA